MANSEQPLAGKAALVTGAGRGIGRAIAERLAADGAHVTLVARDRSRLEAVAQGIRAAGGEAQVVIADVARASDVYAAVDAAVSRFGPVSILVNNAARPGPFGPLRTIEPLEWWETQAINVLGPVIFMHAVIPGMRERRAGRIINIVSSAGLEPVPHLSAYAVSKSTLARVTEIADLEERDHGIRVYALHPGTITTEMAQSTIGSPEAQRWVPEGVAMLRSRSDAESARDLARTRDVVAWLAAGRFEGLGGRYIDLWWDLEAEARQP